MKIEANKPREMIELSSTLTCFSNKLVDFVSDNIPAEGSAAKCYLGGLRDRGYPYKGISHFNLLVRNGYIPFRNDVCSANVALRSILFPSANNETGHARLVQQCKAKTMVQQAYP